MGVGQFFYAVNFSSFGMLGIGFIGPLPFVIIVAFKVALACKTKVVTGAFIDKNNSNLVDKEGKLKKKNLIPLLGNLYGNFAHIFFYSLAYKFAKMGGINQGVVPILTLFAAIFNCVAFYFGFNEKLNFPKVLGMMLAILCGCLLLVDSAGKKGETFIDESGAEQSKALYSFYSLGLAFLVPIALSSKHYLIRKYQSSYNYYFLAIDSAILESLSCSIFFLVFMADNEVEIEQLLIGGLTGGLMIIGRIYIAVGIAEGVAGPAQSVMSTNGIWMTILAVTVDGQELSFLQLMGIVSGLSGAFTVGMGDFLMGKIMK
eukprot:CAMPEP_0168614938 /NCGR_PEP_ID=MMETSP0449_2-20121227/4242_1 /TAXON_ID=1082188 /ORGANISM="Strombidium rassoulzadegani, Strain ras09" /LENGTH=315 /DNA_ID=CAMNT_0008655653 /DNA_START=170 /DNA_END=1117 /DNA_ORIENTATION=-